MTVLTDPDNSLDAVPAKNQIIRTEHPAQAKRNHTIASVSFAHDVGPENA